MIFLGYSILISSITILSTIYLLISYRGIQLLEVQPLITEQPSLIIIIAVRNEEEDLAKALQSVCNINYSNYRIMVVNDRSTDGTADILQGFTTRYPKLTVTTVTELPEGWLGKNNALYQAYKNSTEDWLLFTDADIVFHPDAINKALGYAVKQQLDHLTILPETISRSSVLNSVLGTFGIMLMMHIKPWDAKNPKSKAFVGIGAFNLINRAAYEKAGTHTRIRLRPDDDLQLGRMVKLAGLRQDVLAGKRYVCLEWYKSLGQFGNGILKNSFAVAEYSLGQTVLNVLGILTFVALPLPLMLLFGTTAIRLIAAAQLLSLTIYMIIVPPNKWWYVFMLPFAGFFIAYCTLKSALITLKQGGIYWRDSFYSLSMLKGKE
jgi:cellulose synthase/poly-beta-1,6-N-acetylglucosamine synthase-like glycosyltransferase